MLEAYPRTPLAWHAWLPWSSWQSLERANTQSAPCVDTYVQISARDLQSPNSDDRKQLVLSMVAWSKINHPSFHPEVIPWSLNVLKAQPYPVGSSEPVACQETVEMLEITGHFLCQSVAQCGFCYQPGAHSFHFNPPAPKRGEAEQKRGRNQKVVVALTLMGTARWPHCEWVQTHFSNVFVTAGAPRRVYGAVKFEGQRQLRYRYLVKEQQHPP